MFCKVIRLKTILGALGAVCFLAAAAAMPKAIYTAAKESDGAREPIQWVDFNIPYEALKAALAKDIQSHTTENDRSLNWVEILAWLGARYGGDFSHFKQSDITRLCDTLQQENTDIDTLSKSMKSYAYFKEAYGAVLNGFVGEFSLEVPDEAHEGQTMIEKRYGLKAFSPIAAGYSYSHYDDFGASRSYGYKRRHLGHDLMGGIGTPVIAVESGYVECVGWNRYGGWRIGIRSFDKKRYYYYAHLRKDHPYNDIYEGKKVTAGDVIGYLGMTGYSTRENVNNINTPHLHFGIQLIFDEATQKEGNHEIWIDCYALTKLLEQNRSAVIRDDEAKEYERRYAMFEESTND